MTVARYVDLSRALELPADVVPGDEFALTGRVRVTSVGYEQVDVSSAGGESYANGAADAEVLLYSVQIARLA